MKLSKAVITALGHWSRTDTWVVGCVLAQNKISGVVQEFGTSGSKFCKTLTSVEIVSASSIEPKYLPDQRNVSPSLISTPAKFRPTDSNLS